MKRILALLLSVLFLFAMLAACGNGDTNTSDSGSTDDTTTDSGGTGDGDVDDGPPAFQAPEGTLPDLPNEVFNACTCGGGHDRRIIIGTWYEVYYDSRHESIFDNPSDTLTVETAQMSLDNVRRIEEEYNVCIEFRDLTWEGIMEDIPVSIMSGIPSCDIYMVDMQFGLTPVLRGMATAIEDMDMNSDFKDDTLRATGNIVMQSVQIPGMDKTYLFRGSSIEQGMYMLGYNRDLLNQHGLEDPQELWYAGEWTWDKFREHCRTITDPENDIYGYGGVWTQFLTQMLFTNNASIAAGAETTITSPETIEVFSFIYDLYTVDKVARPWVSDEVVEGGFWSANNDDPFMGGRSGFNVTAAWINQEYLKNDPMPFEIGVVPFPVGPSGDQDTMATVSALGGNWFFIPRYIKDPGLVFEVMYEWTNWFDYDLEYRDDTEWLFNNLISDDNIDIYLDTVSYGFDMWGSLSGAGLSLIELIGYDDVEPEYTPASFAETYYQVYQDALDNYFGG